MKVRVDSTGIHRLSPQFLAELGFKDASKVILAGYGSVERAHTLDTAPDDLPVLPVMRTTKGIFFMAEGDERVRPATSTTIATHYNHYSKGSYYYIGERAGFKSPEITEALTAEIDREDANHLDSHLCVEHAIYREDHPTPHGTASFTKNFAEGGSRIINFIMPDRKGESALYYSLAWLNGSASFKFAPQFSSEVTNTPTTVTLSKNATSSHTIYGVKENQRVALTLANGADKFSATFADPTSVFDYLALRNTALVYPRENRGTDPARMMHFVNFSSRNVIDFSGVNAGLKVWDVTAPTAPVSLPVTSIGSTTAYALPCETSGTRLSLVAFNPDTDKFPEPQFIDEVACQSLHSMDDVDMLIVTTEATYAPSLRLAQAHEKWQGMKVAVVKQSEVFEEFSSGALHPNGLRHLVMMLSERPRPIRYLLLMGHGSWDTRGTYDHSGVEYLVTYSTEDLSENGNLTKAYSSDLYFGSLCATMGASLSKTDVEPTVSVGRVPAYGATEAEAYVDKCIAYLEDPYKAGAFNSVILSCCHGDNLQHIQTVEDMGAKVASYTPNPTFYRNYLDLFPVTNTVGYTSPETQQHLINSLAAGPKAFFYGGHATYNNLNYSNFTSSINSHASYGSLPIGIFLACNPVKNDNTTGCLSENIFFQNPGPIAVIGAGTEVFLTNNMSFGRLIADFLYAPDGGETLGDAFRLATNYSAKHPSNSNQHTNDLDYNFIGDPALPRYNPTRIVNLTALNDNSWDNSSSPAALCPGSKLKMQGTITDKDGNIDTSFNGSLKIDIFESPVKKKSYNYEKAAGHYNDYYQIDEIIASRLSTVVKNGKWEIETIVPPTMLSDSNRASFNAVAEDHKIAAGACVPFAINGAGAQEIEQKDPDTTAPDITMWIDTPDGLDGTLTSHSPILHLEIADDKSGVSMSNSVPGMSTIIALDGSPLTMLGRSLSLNAEGHVSVDHQFDNLADGHHALTVSAVDIAGNRAESTLNFTVVNTNATAALIASESIARDEVTFTLDHSLPAEADQSRLIIRNAEGHTVRSVTSPSFPYTWDFSDNDGFPVADGHYRASALLSSHPVFTASPEVEFIVVKK